MYYVGETVFVKSFRGKTINELGEIVGIDRVQFDEDDDGYKYFYTDYFVKLKSGNIVRTDWRGLESRSPSNFCPDLDNPIPFRLYPRIEREK
jgi:hypothetical protein